MFECLKKVSNILNTTLYFFHYIKSLNALIISVYFLNKIIYIYIINYIYINNSLKGGIRKRLPPL